MSNFITDIHVKDLRHLHDFDIHLSKSQRRHLLITGKNGSGKTTLLDAIARALDNMVNVSPVHEKNRLEKSINLDEKNLAYAISKNEADKAAAAKERLNHFKDVFNELYGEISLDLVDSVHFRETVKDGSFIVAYYKDFRNPKFIEPKSPELPVFQTKIDLMNDTKDNQFLKLLVHYKVQGAMEGFEGNSNQANKITAWFDKFTEILRKLFDDPQLELSFNPRDYTFTLLDKDGKAFKFTQLPAGYRAALDIISDLIFKMQNTGQINRSFDQEGIVLIDEVETHLHLSMQKEILPILTTIFPQVQFIVSTHSPFVLSSIENAVAMDLEKPKVTISDLTDYSYEALAEGYFGIVSSSSDIQDRLDELERYVDATDLKDRDIRRRDRLIKDFERVPEVLAPSAVGRFREIMIKYRSKSQIGL